MPVHIAHQPPQVSLIKSTCLQLDHFIGAFSKLGQAFDSCKSNLAAFGLVAMVILLGAASMFYLFEHVLRLVGGPSGTCPCADPDDYNCSMCESFLNIPNALYFTSIFLGGEWGKTDFTIPGKFVSIFMIIVGIELYALPISMLFDAFADVLDGDDDEDEGGDDDGDGLEDVGCTHKACGCI